MSEYDPANPLSPESRQAAAERFAKIDHLESFMPSIMHRLGMQPTIPHSGGGGGTSHLTYGICTFLGQSGPGIYQYNVTSPWNEFEDLVNVTPYSNELGDFDRQFGYIGLVMIVPSGLDPPLPPAGGVLLKVFERLITTPCEPLGTGTSDPGGGGGGGGGDPGLADMQSAFDGESVMINSISQTRPGPFNGGQSVWENQGGTIKELLDWLLSSVTTLNAAPAAPTIVSAYKTGDESISNTTLQDDNDLTISLAASSIYNFKIFAFISTAGALEGFKAGLNGTAGITSLKAEITIFDDVSNAMVALDRLTAFGSSAGAGLSLGSSFCTIEGTIETSTAGTMLLSWAQNGGAGVAATTVQRNSWMQATKLA